jgi:hypothetical protein
VEHLAPGAGHLPLSDYVRYLAALPAPPSVTIEVYAGGENARPDYAAHDIRQAVRFVRSAVRAGL